MGSSSSSEMSDSKASELVDKLIADNAVVVFSKTYCPFCKKAKSYLNKANAIFKVIELDERSDGDSIQAALREKTGLRTVPNVIIGKKSIGGGDDAEKLYKSGQLQKLLASVNAVRTS